VGWRVSRSLQTECVRAAREPARYARPPGKDGSLSHHADRGAPYVSIRYRQRLAEAGAEPAVGSKGDSDDNALAETSNGRYQVEMSHRRGPWQTQEVVALATLAWVSWCNHPRLLAPSD
jgi:putative transposase